MPPDAARDEVKAAADLEPEMIAKLSGFRQNLVRLFPGKITRDMIKRVQQPYEIAALS